MKILVDENIPLSIVEALRTLEHKVLDLRGTDREGSPDEVLWKIAQSEARVLITTDKGFAQHRHESHFGILIIRLKQPNRQKIHERILRAISDFTPDEWPHLLVTMRDDSFSTWRNP